MTEESLKILKEEVNEQLNALEKLTKDSKVRQYINLLEQELFSIREDNKWHDLSNRGFEYPDDSRQVLIAYVRHPWGYSDFDVVNYCLEDDWYNAERPVAAWREI